ncbi:MAG: hypothetical protein ABEJ95_04800 [Candidatus Nanohalobium sp.]
MSLNMKRNDYIAIAATLLVPLVAAIGLMGMSGNQALVMLTMGTTILAGIGVIAALVAIYKGREGYGGLVARNLEIIGIGLALFIVTYIPHVLWHIFGLMNRNPLGPGWIGLTKAWWAGFFHIGAIAFFLISSYGFYLFWSES